VLIQSRAEYHQDLWIAIVPLACGDEAFDGVTELGDGECGDVGARHKTDCIEDCRQDVLPVSSAATNKYGQPGIIWCLASPRP
jgi:hypothetical protein